jgi:hypothetical protein
MPNHPHDTRRNTSRRVLLKGAAGIAGALAAMNTAQAASYGNMAKTTVGYRVVPNGSQACGNCALFIPGSSPAAEGRCKSVAGVISPKGWCRIWAPEKGIRNG